MSIVKFGNPVVLIPGKELYEHVNVGFTCLAQDIDHLTMGAAARDHLKSAIQVGELENPTRHRDEFVRDFLTAALLDTMEANSSWVKLHGSQDRVGSGIWSYFELEHLDSETADEVAITAIKYLIGNNVNELLCQYAIAIDGGHENWRVWGVRPLGADFIIEDIGDYRVIDWMRQRELKNEKALERAETGETAEVVDEDQRFIELLRKVQFSDKPLIDSNLSRLSAATLKKKRVNRGSRG